MKRCPDPALRFARRLRDMVCSGLLAAVMAACLPVAAQVLSSPLGASPSRPAGNAAPGQAPDMPARDGSFTLPAGQGAGHYSANSVFPALSARDDVVPWSVLTAVKTRRDNNRILPVFNLGQMALNQKSQRIQGYMMPLDPGEKQKHFLLSSVPLSCPFCLPGGPESMIEVKTKTPVKYSMEPLVVEGRFLVLNDDAMGLYYRMLDATSVR